MRAGDERRGADAQGDHTMGIAGGVLETELVHGLADSVEGEDRTVLLLLG